MGLDMVKMGNIKNTIMNIKAPAKINIGLRIIGKREDGYHNIETIFYPVSLYDNLQVDVSPSRKNINSVFLSSNNPVLPNNNTNICYKAVINFFKTFRITRTYQIKIHIEKKIPIGGGLGGGSSDAAAVLKYMIRYFGVDINVSRKEILLIAEQTGSDVPFFLIAKPCLATGKGEKLKLLPDFKINNPILIVNTNQHISTKWAYENLKIESSFEKDYIFNDVLKLSDIDFQRCENDFEPSSFGKYPELKEVKDLMYQNNAIYSSMSGSGSTMFGIFKNNEDIKKSFDYFIKKGYFTRTV